MDQLPPEIQVIIRREIGDENHPINTVFVLRGLPGSGKSTFANKLLRFCESIGTSITICNADEWFYVKGKYKWNSSELNKAHAYSKGQFALAVLEKHDVIVVDNTNLKEEDFLWYVEQATGNFYRVAVVEWHPRNKEDAIATTERSVHVPREYDGWFKYDRVWSPWTPEGMEDQVEIVQLLVQFQDRAQEYARRGYFCQQEVETSQIHHRGRGFERNVTFRGDHSLGA